MVQLQPIEKRRLSETIVEELRKRILGGEWKPGDFLPPERELSQTLGVTRVSLREALRMLEQESLIETRHGEGSQVRDFTESAGLGVLKHLVKLGLPSPELLRSTLEFRAILGTELTRLAAQKAGADDIEALAAIIAAEERDIDNPSAVQRWDFLFFERLAVASRNQLIKFLMNTIREPYLQQGDLFSPLIGEPRELLGYHKGILSAVKAGNPTQAAKLAGQYLNHGMNRIFKEEG